MNLAELIRTQKMGRTFAALEADCGGYPSAQRIQQMASQAPKNFPDPVTIRALAKGLRVTEVTVVLASAESLGLDVSRATPRVLDFLPADVNELSEEQLFAIGNMLRSFIPAMRHAEDNVIEMHPDTQSVEHVIVEYSDPKAARQPDARGSRGRRDRRDQDESETGSQDPGGIGGHS